MIGSLRRLPKLIMSRRVLPLTVAVLPYTTVGGTSALSICVRARVGATLPTSCLSVGSWP